MQIREVKKGGYVVRFRKGKKFYRGDSLEEAKIAFKNQYKKKCKWPLKFPIFSLMKKLIGDILKWVMTLYTN